MCIFTVCDIFTNKEKETIWRQREDKQYKHFSKTKAGGYPKD